MGNVKNFEELYENIATLKDDASDIRTDLCNNINDLIDAIEHDKVLSTDDILQRLKFIKFKLGK